jgi:hypothetical protein
MYQKKYLKYKKKYLDLKGGDIISYDDKIDDNIISDVSFEDYPNPYEKTFPMIKKELLIYDVDSTGTNIQPLHVYEDSNQIRWVLEGDKVFLNKYKKPPYWTYWPYRFSLILYSLPLEQDDLLFCENFYIHIPDTFLPDIYKFTLKASLFGIEINLFNAIYSFRITEAIFSFILDWIYERINTYKNRNILTVKPISIIKQTQIFFTNKLYNNTNLVSDSNFKVHMNIKLENYFWVLETLIKNYHRFTNLISMFKIDIGFPGFSILNQLWNRTGDNSKEEAQMPNIVFYPLEYTHFPKTYIQENVKNIINILKELFPEHLNLSSNLFPRFNFRISDCIYFAVGGSDDKFDNPCNYIAPSDYIEKRNNCNIMNKDKCMLTNLKTKTLSNHELCIYNDEKNECEINNIKNYNLLNLNIFAGKNTREIYAMVGQTDIYDKLIGVDNTILVR